MPKTPETTGMIGTAQLKAMKKTAYVVNVARGGLIDEAALAAALKAGEIAGAGIDVFTSEPPTDDVLTSAPNIVVTPHLGASTDEAQEKAGVSVARVGAPRARRRTGSGCRQRRRGCDRPVRAARHRRWSRSSAQVLAAVAGHGALTDLEVDVRGELAAYDVSVLPARRAQGRTSPTR